MAYGGRASETFGRNSSPNKSGKCTKAKRMIFSYESVAISKTHTFRLWSPLLQVNGNGPQLWPFLFTDRVDMLTARWGGYYSQVRVSYYLLATSCKLLVTSY